MLPFGGSGCESLDDLCYRRELAQRVAETALTDSKATATSSLCQEAVLARAAIIIDYSATACMRVPILSDTVDQITAKRILGRILSQRPFLAKNLTLERDFGASKSAKLTEQGLGQQCTAVISQNYFSGPGVDADDAFQSSTGLVLLNLCRTFVHPDSHAFRELSDIVLGDSSIWPDKAATINTALSFGHVYSILCSNIFPGRMPKLPAISSIFSMPPCRQYELVLFNRTEKDACLLQTDWAYKEDIEAPKDNSYHKIVAERIFAAQVEVGTKHAKKLVENYLRCCAGYNSQIHTPFDFNDAVFMHLTITSTNETDSDDVFELIQEDPQHVERLAAFLGPAARIIAIRYSMPTKFGSRLEKHIGTTILSWIYEAANQTKSFLEARKVIRIKKNKLIARNAESSIDLETLGSEQISRAESISAAPEDHNLSNINACEEISSHELPPMPQQFDNNNESAELISESQSDNNAVGDAQFTEECSHELQENILQFSVEPDPAQQAPDNEAADQHSQRFLPQLSISDDVQSLLSNTENVESSFLCVNKRDESGTTAVAVSEQGSVGISVNFAQSSIEENSLESDILGFLGNRSQPEVYNDDSESSGSSHELRDCDINYETQGSPLIIEAPDSSDEENITSPSNFVAISNEVDLQSPKIESKDEFSFDKLLAALEEIKLDSQNKFDSKNALNTSCETSGTVGIMCQSTPKYLAPDSPDTSQIDTLDIISLYGQTAESPKEISVNIDSKLQKEISMSSLVRPETRDSPTKTTLPQLNTATQKSTFTFESKLPKPGISTSAAARAVVSEIFKKLKTESTTDIQPEKFKTKEEQPGSQSKDEVAFVTESENDDVQAGFDPPSELVIGKMVFSPTLNDCDSTKISTDDAHLLWSHESLEFAEKRRSTSSFSTSYSFANDNFNAENGERRFERLTMRSATSPSNSSFTRSSETSSAMTQRHRLSKSLLQFSGRCSSAKSNQRLVIKALQVLLAGAVNATVLCDLIARIKSANSEHAHLILLRGSKNHKFVGLYLVTNSASALGIISNPNTSSEFSGAVANDDVSLVASRLFGSGPKEITSSDAECFFKFDSGARAFRTVPTKTLSFFVHAVSLQSAVQPKERT